MTTPRQSALEAVAEAARRARDSLCVLIRELYDPGTEAIAAEWCLSRELAALDALGPADTDDADTLKE
jgi:DNA-binding IclR family transcriptional regulator